MKLTPKVAELERRCLKTEQDTLAYAERASVVWGARIRGALLAAKQLCGRRDVAAGRLYDAISKVRQKLRPQLTPRQEKDHFFFSGPTPRQPPTCSPSHTT